MDMQADFGIVFALSFELREFVKALRRRGYRIKSESGLVQATMEKSSVLALASGVGWRRARMTTNTLISKGVRVILAAGIAGGLDPKLSHGDVIVARRIYSEMSADCSPIACSSVVNNLCVDKTVPAIRWADVVSCECVVGTPDDKARLFAETGAAAVDMESYAVGQVCENAGIRFFVVRAISDTAADKLPFVLVDGCLSTSTLLRTLCTQPGELIGLLRFYVISCRAAKKLAEFLVDLLVKRPLEDQDHL